MSNKIILKNKGLNTQSNDLGSVPEGALLTAKNIVIDKDDVAEIRRGFNLFSDAMGNSSTNVAKQLMQYKKRLFRQYEPTDNTGYLEYQLEPGSTGFGSLFGLKNIFGTLSSTGTNVAMTTNQPHGLFPGEQALIEGASPTGYNGLFIVTDTPDDNTFTYSVTGVLAPPSSGTPLLFESSFKEARQTSNDDKMRSVEANGNFYFTTELGVKKLDTYNATVIDTGVSPALDVDLSLVDDASGFFEEETQIGYRVVWGIKDLNDNLILGAASSRAFISNPGTTLLITDFNGLSTELNNEAVLSGTYVTIGDASTLEQINTALTGTIVTLTGESALSAIISGLDAVANAATGTTLIEIQASYDNLISLLETQEPPLTGDFEFATTSQNVSLNFTVPQGITTDHFYQIYRTSPSVDLNTLPNDDYQLVYENNPTLEQLNAGVVTVVDITPDAFRGAALYQNNTQETDSQANNRPPFATDVALFNNILFYSNTRTLHRSTFSLVGLDPLTIGLSTLTINHSTTSFTINFGASEDISTNTAYLDMTADSTVAQRVDTTARSIVRVINRINNNPLVNAYYISGPNDPPGSIVLESKNITNGDFSVVATNSYETIDGTIISAYSPPLITPLVSNNETKPNRIYYSKLGEPEAVPLLNYFSVGGGDNNIFRIAALRDSLFIFSDQGVFRITGDDPSALVLAAFDNTCFIKCSNSIAKGNNQIFLFSDQGIVSVSDTGVSIISRQIEDQLLPLLNSSYANFAPATFATFYQSDRKYILFTLTEPTDVVATRAFVYNTLTNTWVLWDMSKTSALVDTVDDKLYLGAADINRIEQERKNFDYTDHADRQHDAIIISVSRLITAISTGEPTQITAKFHGLIEGDIIEIVGSNSTPSIDGEWPVNIIDDDMFTIDVNVTVAGTAGVWTAVDKNVPMKLEMDSLLNIDIGDVILQTKTSSVGSITYDYDIDLIVTAIDVSNSTVTLNSLAAFEPGPCIIYDFIPVEILWVPIHAGDPSITKQFREVHVMYDKFIGTDTKLLFSSDVQVSEDQVDFDLLDFGNWGKFNWGKQPWGGQATTKNIRSYIPLGKQRCRVLNLTLKHEAARESWRLEGIAVFFKVQGVGERSNRTS